jgi:hypothetical protein
MPAKRLLAAVLLVVILAVGESSGVTPSVGGTDVLTPVRPTSLCPADCTPDVGVAYDYRNNLDVNLTGIVWWVIHNSLGQTVAFGTSFVSIPAGSNLTGYVVCPLPLGSYNSTVFATTTGGVAISSSAFVVFTRG